MKALPKGPSAPGVNVNDQREGAVMEVNDILDRISKSMASRLGKVTFPHYFKFVKPHLEVQLYSQSLRVWFLAQEKCQAGESLAENLWEAEYDQWSWIKCLMFMQHEKEKA